MAEASTSARRAERTLYASPLEMAEWLAAARGGAAMKYASGPALDPREPAAILAGTWGRAGAAHPYQVRGAAGVTDYWVRKLVPASLVLRDGLRPPQDERGLVAAAGRPPADSAWPETDQGRIYRLLCRCANLAQACPSNAAIGERLALRDRYVVKYEIGKLRERGLIVLEAAAKFGPRVVRIVASGKVTAERMGRD